MQEAAKPINELLRLEALRRLAILDTPAEARFDQITTLAARTFRVPIALVSLVDADRQWFKSCYGLSERETPRSISFCSHAVFKGDVLVVNDASHDERFANNPLVRNEPHIRFYAGCPLYTPQGYIAGTFCVIDKQPRDFDADSLELLRGYALWAQHEMNAVELNRAFTIVSESEARFRSIFDHSPIGVAMVGMDGRCLQANHALCVMLGSSAAQLQHLDFKSLLHAGHVDNDLAQNNQLLAGEISSYTVEQSHVLGDGRSIWVLLTITLVREPDCPFYFIYQLQDISEHKQLEKMKSEFLSTAAHELRLPMASIHGFAALLMQREFDESRQREMLGIIHNQAARMTNLIDELLDLARIESRLERTFDIRRQPLEPIVHEALTSFPIPPGREPIELHIVQPLPELAMDAEKIRQVLDNILSNAYKYSPQGGAVSLSVTATSTAVQIAVADRGVGLSAEHLAKIFEPFFRAPGNQKIRGTGLGMTLVKQVIEAHHGHIEVTSQLGVGTEVMIKLPVD